MLGSNIKTVLVIAGAITAVVGTLIDNWKVATIGNTVAVIGLIL